MKCPNCGAFLEEDSRFCISCGANLEEIEKSTQTTPDLASKGADPRQQESGSAPIASFNTAKNGKAGMQRMVGLIVGTLFIILAIMRVMSAGTSISSTSFGGDFYTYTYQGIVAVSEILASIEVSLGWIIAAIGAAIDLSALRS